MEKIEISKMNFNSYVKAFDYFLIFGINNKYLQGNKTFEFLQNLDPEILSMFPECNEKDRGDINPLVNSM